MKEFFLTLHFIGLAMGLGTSFAFMFLGIAGSKLPKEEAVKFAMKTFALSRMGHIGLGLLLLSGIYLIYPYIHILGAMPWLIVKLMLVLLWFALVGIISSTAKKASSGNTETHLMKIKALGRLSMITGLLIVVVAVLSFH
ncbi:MAG: hypothetical protein IT242_07535 [Bacteroidia bacterium]|nr:hypothetical protein [Bacteroidia bacterium]